MTTGMGWCLVSHRVSDCSKSGKIASKFLGASQKIFDLVVWVIEVIKTFSNLFMFFTKRFHTHKKYKNHKKHKKHQTQTSDFYLLKVFARTKNCSPGCFLHTFICFVSLFSFLIIFVFAYFCFNSLFLLVVLCLLIFVLLVCFDLQVFLWA